MHPSDETPDQDAGAAETGRQDSSAGDNWGDKDSYLHILNQFSLSLIELQTEEQLVWNAAREVVGKMGFVDCVIYLLDDERDMLIQSAASGGKNPKDEVIMNRLEIPVGEGITGYVAKTGEALLIPDLSQDDRYLHDVIKARSEICVPLVYKGEILGAIDCEDTRLNHFTKAHMEILTTVASLVSAKLVQVMTIERLEKTVAQLRSAEKTQAVLFRIASVSQTISDIDHFYREIHEIVGSLMSAENLFFGIYRKDKHILDFPYYLEAGRRTKAMRSFEGKDLDKTASGYVLRNDSPTLLSGAEFVDHVRAGDFDLVGREPVSWLGIPFAIDRNRTGILVVQSYDEDITYSEQDADLLAYISQQISKTLSHKIALEALSESEERFSRAAAGSNEGIWDWNMESGEGWFSDRWAEIIGIEREEFDPNFDRFLAMVHPDDKSAVLEATSAHLKKRVPYDLEFRLRHRDRHYVWVRSRGQAVWDEDGAATRMAGSLQDLTEQKEAEEKLRRAQKLEAVGQLTGGIAHDFNNLLAVILGNLDMAIEKNDAGEEHGRALDLALQGALRGADLTKRLLTFSGQQSLEDRVVDVNQAIGEMIELLQRALGEEFTVVTVLADKLGPAKFDPAQFESAILNLALNARDAMPKGGEIKIQTEVCAADPAIEGGEVSISVIDTGAGMTDEVREHALEPFFTTKEVGKGSGLGLSMVYGFVRQSGGRLSIESEPGKGTSIHIYLPVTLLEGGASTTGDIPLELHVANGETVLLIEDNADVMQLLNSQLEALGYKVLQAVNGAQALEIIESPAPIDVILSDVVLPGGIDGLEILEKAKIIRPELPGVLMSGHPARSAGDGKEGRIETFLLRKPFKKADVANAIRQALDNGQDSGSSTRSEAAP